ncbi:C1 family peptidase [Hugonella massiliensis]|uniref:aminopeptidase C n=1 Tax=Hugonella massiliensis TaxID=1720315 RepID=UPI00073E3ED0|nr:C1 family peptidase [Hugonella massiliensis]
MTNSPNETTSPSASACETGALTFDAIARNARDFAADRSNVVAKNAVTSNGVRAAARVPEQVARNTTVFDVEIKQGDRTDQQRSGRCWMFASLNTMRIRTIKKFNLKTFEFSQAYPLYWDKLEKANWFFENILSTLDEPRDGRLVAFLLADPVGDGGQWDMFRALVKKYGVVPKEAMPDTACAKNTYEMDAYLTRYLRKCACELRCAHEGGASVDELRSAKERMLANVQRMLTICLGEPPKTFDVRLRDTDDKLALSGTFTPREFFERTVGMELDDYVSVISAPTADKPFGHTYTVERLGNVVEVGGVRYLNLPVDRLKEMAATQLKDGLPVWFGCDVDQSYLQKDGVMDRDAVNVDALFGFEIDRGFDKAQRLDFGESVMTHAMTLEGVNLDANGKPTLWKVENSWGKDHGKDGFDSLTDDWFGEYVYQVVVDKKYLTDGERRVYDTEEPTVLAPWDPLGALAD